MVSKLNNPMPKNHRRIITRDIGTGIEALCKRCERWRTAEQMAKNKFRPLGIQPVCNECIAARRAEERAAMTNEEIAEQKRQHAEYMREWRKQNRTQGVPEKQQ